MKEKIEIDGHTYVREDTLKTAATNTDGLPLVLVRQKDSGVHFGYLKSENNGTVVLLKARRVWYWKGAASLSQLANDGPSYPKECKIPAAVEEITIYGICEKIPVTEAAAEKLKEVPAWKA